MNDFEELMQSAVSRRAFLARMSAAGLGGAAAALLAGCGGGSDTVSPSGVPTKGGTASPSPASSFLDPTNFPGIVGRSEDEVVLNYALTLEILEADLYRQALNIASGRAVTAALDSTQPAVGTTGNYTQSVGNGSVSGSLAAPGFLYLVQYAYVEAAHRDFLRTVLGSIGAPTATTNPNGYTAPFGSDLGSILGLLYAVEETGVRAYLGAAGFISNITYLTTAVAIHSTEARHSSALAYILGKDTGPAYSIAGVPRGRRVTDGAIAPNQQGDATLSTNTFQYYTEPPVVLSAVKPFFK